MMGNTFGSYMRAERTGWSVGKACVVEESWSRSNVGANLRAFHDGMFGANDAVDVTYGNFELS